MSNPKDHNGNPINFEDLPGFVEAKTNLEEKGFLSAWIYETIDPKAKYAIFLKNGKPGYKSPCPYYEGYWLCGGFGSVQCRAVDTLFPGLQWDITCGKKHEQCPFYKPE